MSRTTRRITGVAVAGICAAALAAPALAAPTAGPDTSKAPGQDAVPDPDPVVQRLPREPRAAVGLQRPIQTGAPTGTDADHGRRRRRVPRDAPQAGPRRPRATRVTVAAGDMVGASPLLSAAFHDEPTVEAHEQARPRRHLRGQPRVRRGLQGAPAPPARRLHRRRSDGAQQPELLRRRHLQGREVPVPRRQRPREGLRQDDPAALRDQERSTAPRSASSA